MRRPAGQVVTALASLGLVLLLDLAGVVEWTDHALRRVAYGLRGTRDSSFGVVLVTADDATAQAWGAPPWDGRRLESLLSAVARGHPTRVALLEPDGALFDARLPEGSTAWPVELLVREAERTGPVAAERARVVLPRHGNVESLPLRTPSGEPSFFARLLGTAAPQGGRRLGVNYLGPAHALPQVPAWRVVQGDVPAGIFQDKLVLIGSSAAGRSSFVPTPVGLLSVAEVEAHGALAALDGVPLRLAPGWLRWVLLVVFAAGLVSLLPRLSSQRAMIVLALSGVGAAVASLLLFAASGRYLGAGSFLILLPCLAAATGWFERWTLGRRLEGLLVGTQEALGRNRESEEALWTAFGTRALRLAACERALLAELPRGRWSLAPRFLCGVAEEAAARVGTDVRQEPFAEPLRSLQPAWVDGLLHAEETSLVLPVASAAQVQAFVILSFPTDRTPSAATVRLLELFAGSLAQALRDRAPAAGSLQAETSRLLRHVEGLDAAVAEIRREQRQGAALVEALPAGVLTASVWGELLTVNAAMHRLFPSLEVVQSKRGGLVEWMVTELGLRPEECHDVLHAVAAQGATRRFVLPAHGGAARCELTIAPARAPEGEARLLGILVVASAADAEATPASAPKDPLDAEDPVVELAEARQVLRRRAVVEEPERIVDPRELAMRALRACRRLTCLPAREVQLQFADPLPAVRVRPGPCEEALIAVLHDVLRHGTGAIVLGVEREAGEVRVVVANGGETVPLVLLESVLQGQSSSSGHAECSVAGLDVARTRAEGAGARLSVATDLLGCTTFVLALAPALSGGGERTSADTASGA